MSYNRGKKISKKDKVVKKTISLLASLEELEKKGALHINRDTRECHLIKELFWDGKTLAWKNNFVRNVAFLMDRNQDKPIGSPIKFYSIDIEKKERGDYLISFIPGTGVLKETQS